MELNKIYNEDCLATMKRMPDNFIDMVMTSPPYDNLRKYNGFSFDFESTATELFRVMKDGAVCVWVVGDSTINGSESATSFKQALFFIQCGFRLHDTMIYLKNNFIQLNHNRYEQCFEYMFCFSKGKPKTFNPIKEKCIGAGKVYNKERKGYCSTVKEGANRRRAEIIVTNETKIKSNIFNYSCGSEKANHPAPFPTDLAKDQIFSWSNENEIVYDPFMGSGTTAIQCHLQNRIFIGSEISTEYFTSSTKKIAPYLEQTIITFPTH